MVKLSNLHQIGENRENINKIGENQNIHIVSTNTTPAPEMV